MSLSQTPKEIGLTESVWVEYNEPPPPPKPIVAPPSPKTVEKPVLQPPPQKKSAVVVPPLPRSPLQQPQTYSAASQTKSHPPPPPQQQQQQHQHQARTLISAAQDTKTLEMAEAHAAALRTQLQSQPLQIQLRLNMKNALQQHAKLQQASLRKRRPSPSDSSSSSSSSTFETPLLIAEQPPAYQSTNLLGTTQGVGYDYSPATSIPRVAFAQHPPPGNGPHLGAVPNMQAPPPTSLPAFGFSSYGDQQTFSPPPPTAVSPAAFAAYQPLAPTPTTGRRITTPSNTMDVSQQCSVPPSSVGMIFTRNPTSTVDEFETTLGNLVLDDQLPIDRTQSNNSLLQQLQPPAPIDVSIQQQYPKRRTLSMVKAQPDTSCDALPSEADELIRVLLGGGVFKNLEQEGATPQHVSQEVINYYTSRMSQDKKDAVLKALSTKLLEQYVAPTPPPVLEEQAIRPIVSEPITADGFTVPSSVVLLDQALLPSAKTTPTSLLPISTPPGPLPQQTLPLQEQRQSLAGYSPHPTPTDELLSNRRTPIVRTPLPIGPGASDPTTLLDPVFEWNEPPKPTLIERIKNREHHSTRDPSGSRYTASSTRTRDTPTTFTALERKRSVKSRGRNDDNSRSERGNYNSNSSHNESHRRHDHKHSFDQLPSQPSMTAEQLQREITNLFMTIDPSITATNISHQAPFPEMTAPTLIPEQQQQRVFGNTTTFVPQEHQQTGSQRRSHHMIPVKVNVNYNRRTTESSIRSDSGTTHLINSLSPQPRHTFSPSQSRSLQYSEMNPPPPPDENESDEETVVGSFS